MDIDQLFRALPAGFDPEVECEQLFGRLEELDVALTDVTSTATSPDGLVEVTVGASGELRDLVLDPRIYHRPHSEELARSIVATAAIATAAVAERVRVSTRRALGGEPA